MSMFNRNDKVNDTNAGTNPGMNTGETARLPEISPVPAPPAAKPAQPVAQPVSNIAAPRNIGVSVISKALKITGQLESTEDIRIDGEVEGDVRAVSVTVGSGAKVKGTVYGNAVELSGTIDGKIEAEKVVLTSTAHMTGDVIHRDLRIESGAYIAGNCRPEFGKNEDRAAHSASKPTLTGLAAKSSDPSAIRA
jgi:cytoskeletal protein CcmA (bactofilin family)